MHNRFLNIAVLILISLITNGQQFNRKEFTIYQTREGLSNNHVWSITQDAYGYIWVSTEIGLNRFDGSGFQQFYSDSSAESLPQDLVHDLVWCNKEELAALTSSGLHIINSRTLQRYNLIIPADSLKQLSIVNKVYDATADNKGNIFIVTFSGFYHFNKKDLVFRYDHYSRKDLEYKTVQFASNVIQISDSLLILSATDRIYLYNTVKKELRLVNDHDDPFVRDILSLKKRISVIYKDKNYFSLIAWPQMEIHLFNIHKRTRQTIHVPVAIRERLSSSATMYRYNDSIMLMVTGHKGFYKINHDNRTGSWVIDSTAYLENEFCTSLFIDKNSRLWVGTINGLYKQNRSVGHIEQVTLPGEGTSIQKTISSCAVANNKLFIGTSLEGLYIFDRDSLRFLRHLMTPEKDFSFITELVKINEDSLMIAKKGVLFNTHNLTYKKIDLGDNMDPSKVLKVLFIDSRNRIFFTKKNSDTLFFKKPGDDIFSFIKLPEFKSIVSETQVAEDHEGHIWFGGHGLIRLNDQSKKIDLFLDSFPAIKNQTKRITSNIVFDNTGKMYFGLIENGLIIYDTKEKKFSQITRSHGLPDNTILALSLYKNKTLWIASENGLANYDIDKRKVSAFGASDGMPIDPSTCHTLYYDSANNHLYAAFTHTIVRFDPTEVKKNQTPPDFFVESIDIAGRNSLHHPDGSITVPYKHNNIIINLTTINYEDAPQQLFAYRLLKNDKEPWQEIGTQRKIFLSSLPAGKHKLQIKVYIRNQSWPDQIEEIMLIVRPPFWKTIWFYLAICLIIATLLFYLHKLRIKQLTQKANIDKQLAQTEMKALHAQMNPHFIFNCLNSIREMILNNENEQASLYLSKFARLIRITLNQSSKPFVSLSDTIDYLERYIEMEKIRSNHFTYTIDMGDDLQASEIMLPAMLIQPFIENAIWHGTLSKKNLDVHVSFRKKGNELICIVEDNGIGIEESLQKKENTSSHPSVGIANIRQRIELLNEKYNLQSSVIIQDKKNLTPNNVTGTVVTLHLPIKTNESLWAT